MHTTSPRFQARPQRVTGCYVLDTHTGATWTGLTTPGAQQLAGHLNRTAAPAYTPGDRIRDRATNAVGTVAALMETGCTLSVAWDNAPAGPLSCDRAELVCRADARTTDTGPVWADQQLTIGDTPADAQQGALFAL